MRQNLQSVMDHVNNLEAFVERMRNGTDEESTMLLARLRLGESIEKMMHATGTPTGAYGTGQRTTVSGVQQEYASRR